MFLMPIAEVLSPKKIATVLDNSHNPGPFADLSGVAQVAWSKSSVDKSRPFREIAASVIVAFDDAFAQVATGERSAFSSLQLLPPKKEETICCDAAGLYA